jgi:hypothetical protein
VVLENYSDRRFEARFEGDLVAASDDHLVRPALSPTIVPAPVAATGAPGEVRVYLQNDFTAKEFAVNYEARQEGRPLAAGTVTVRDDRDNGVIGSWDMSLTGCPLEPHPRRGSVGVTVPHHITEGSGRRSPEYELLPPRRRTYRISRQDGIALPTPAFDQRTGWWGRLLGR